MIQTAQIVAVGDEVLWGETVNTNAAWMANFLKSFGVRPTSHMVVADNTVAIGQAVRQALRAADLTVVIGGLGPTPDDRTLDAISEALERRLLLDAATLEHIQRRHSPSAGWRESAGRQARVLDGALVWENPRGQAPGQLIESASWSLVVLPGPPREMQGIAERWMGRWLTGKTPGPVMRDTYSVFDLGESAVAQHLTPLLGGDHPRAGIYAQPGRVDIRIETRDTDFERVLRERSRVWILSRVPVAVFELGTTSREEFLVSWLKARQLTLAAMESLTGGLLLATLIAPPGASGAIKGGVVAYTDEMKERYGVKRTVLADSGAVSEACVGAMAAAIRERSGAAIGVATTGYAGPDGGDGHHPVGSFYVAATDGTELVVRQRYAPLERLAVQQIAVQTAISAVWELLKLPTILNTREIAR